MVERKRWPLPHLFGEGGGIFEGVVFREGRRMGVRSRGNRGFRSGRRRWSDEDNARMVSESLVARAVSDRLYGAIPCSP